MKRNSSASDATIVASKTLSKPLTKSGQPGPGKILNRAVVLQAFRSCARRKYHIVAQEVCEAMKDFGTGKGKCKYCKWRHV